MKKKAQAKQKAPFFSFERWGFVKDIVLIYLFLMAISYFFLSPGTYNALAIHPFWIAVVLISSHHGTAAGVLSAIVGALLFQLSADPAAHLSSDGDYYQLALEKWGQPILWFMAAIFLGELRHNTLKKFKESRNTIARLTLQNQTLTAYCDELQELTSTLEHKISIQDQKTSPYFLEKISALEDFSGEEIQTKLPPFMEDLFGTVTFSLYEKKNGHFVPTVFSGSKTAASKTNLTGKTLPEHIQNIVEKPDFLSALSKDDSPILGKNALFSGPIFKYNPSQKSNVLIGILSIEMLEANHINAKTAVLFRLVCTQLSHNIAFKDNKDNNRIAIQATTTPDPNLHQKH